MNTNSEYIIEELLVRYCEGKVSEEEAIYVRHWMKKSDENRRMAQRINRLCLAADALELEDKLDVAGAFQKVQKHKNVRHMRKVAQWLQKAAAVLLIPVLAFGIMQYNDKQLHDDQRLVKVYTHPGMSSSLTLPDGTVVHLNSASSLTYPARFEGDIRQVSLTGEAYFEVSKDSTRKFIVSAPHQTRIEVLGTHFNLEAYEDNNRVLATLLEGKINFVYHRHNQAKGVSLNPGNKVIYDANTSEVQLLHTSGICETGWTKGQIILEDTPMEEALHQLGKYFHADFVIANPALKEYSFTGVFSNQSLERVLDKFLLSSHIRWRYLNDESDTEKKLRIEIY